MKSFLADRPRMDAPAAPAAPASALRAPAAVTGQPAFAAAPRPAARPAPARGAPHDAPPVHAHASTVECVREGDRVSRIIVTCGCGERIEIDCLYASRA